MKVLTDSERVRTSRRLVLELLGSSRRSLDGAGRAGLPRALRRDAPSASARRPRPIPSATGSARGHHASQMDRRRPRSHAPVKVDNELYVRDYAKCILCYKCVDACGEQYQNTFAIAVAGRGFDARISTEFVVELPESACVYCGNCIAVCPTGALMFRREHELREPGEWDEDGPDRDADRSAPTAASAATSSCTCRTMTIVKVTSPGRPRCDARQPLHQGPLRLPARPGPRRRRVGSWPSWCWIRQIARSCAARSVAIRVVRRRGRAPHDRERPRRDGGAARDPRRGPGPGRRPASP